MDNKFIGNIDDLHSLLDRVNKKQLPVQSFVKFRWDSGLIPVGVTDNQDFIVPKEFYLVAYGFTVSQNNPDTELNFNVKEQKNYYFDSKFNTRHAFLNSVGSHYSSQKLVKFAMPVIWKPQETITVEMSNDHPTIASPELDLIFHVVCVYDENDLAIVLRKIEVLNV